jgi:predicted amidohydrolase YtcJ
MRNLFAPALCIGAFIGCGGGAPAHAAGNAELVLLHGKVITVDAHDSLAQAIAIADGKILMVGSDAEVESLAGPNTRTIDLRGRTVTPGLIDSHIHAASGGFEEIYGITLSNVRTIKEIQDLVKARVATLKPGEWVHGEGWDEGKLAERRLLLASDLDPVSPQNPVWLSQTSGHYGTANSVALRLSKVTARTRDPAAGTIGHLPDGPPNGVLMESAQDLVFKHIPEPTQEQLQRGILHIMEELHAEGMTAIKDPAIQADTWNAYQTLLNAGRLDLDVCVLWDAGATLESARKALTQVKAHPRLPQSLGEGRLLSCGVKLFMDGAAGGRTAWMYQPWNKNVTETDGDNVGYPAEDPKVFRQQVALFHRAGVHIGTHAIGDRAIDVVVDAYAQALEQSPTKGLRHSLIHGNLPTSHAIDVLAKLQQKYDAGYPETQPGFMWWIGDLYAGNYGRERRERIFPLHTFAQRGILWAGGSDFSVSPLAARLGMWAAVDREPISDRYGKHPFGSAESADMRATLRAYTHTAARQLFLEDRTGSIEVGKDADLAVWTQDPLTIPTGSIKDMHCEMTFFRGKQVFAAAK